MKNQNRQFGFTLIEVIVVMAILAAIAAATFPRLSRIADDNTVSAAAEEMRHILVASREHRLATGAWPANVNVLVAANRLPADAITSPFNTNYALAPVGVNRLQISVDARMNKFASKLVGMNLPFVARAGTVITSETTPAGDEASHAGLYALDGSRALTGNMNANGNNINNVNNLNATNVNATNVVASDDLRANDDLFAGNDLDVGGNGHIFGSLTVDSNITAGGNINASGNVQASGDLIGQNDVYGRRFFDRDDPTYVMNPNGNSRFNNMSIDGQVLLSRIVSAGQACSPGEVGLNSAGVLLTCKSGVFAASTGNYSSLNNFGDGYVIQHDVATSCPPFRICGFATVWGQRIVTGNDSVTVDLYSITGLASDIYFRTCQVTINTGGGTGNGSELTAPACRILNGRYLELTNPDGSWSTFQFLAMGL